MKRNIILIGMMILALFSLPVYSDSMIFCLNSTTQQINITQILFSNNNQTNITISENIFCQYNCSIITGKCNPAQESKDFSIPLIIIALFFIIMSSRIQLGEEGEGWQFQAFLSIVGIIFIVFAVQTMVISAANQNTISLLTSLEVLLVFVSIIFVLFTIVKSAEYYSKRMKKALEEKEKDRM